MTTRTVILERSDGVYYTIDDRGAVIWTPFRDLAERLTRQEAQRTVDSYAPSSARRLRIQPDEIE